MTSPTPALVSGPGALSQRTDQGQPLRHIADAKYGEDKENIAQQKMAPLANSADQGAAGPSRMPMVDAPSAGPLGAGPGPYFAADDTGILAEFAWKLAQMGL
jgi:hypothetical protein